MWLLHETDRSVTDICLDVGFTSLGTFSRTFRVIVGVSPIAYRRGSAPIRGAVPPLRNDGRPALHGFGIGVPWK
jgi:AraC-like DNA-binding protein